MSEEVVIVDLPECDCCGYCTAALKPYPKGVDRKETKMLCALCATTYTGMLMEFPNQQGERYQVMQTICFVGNVILDTIKKRSEA